MKIKRIISIITAAVLAVCSVVTITAVEPNSAKLKVIDISKWNTSINWSVVSKSVDGVIAQIGYRGSEYRNNIVEDTMFYNHMQGISQNNISFGVYFYSYAYTEAEAVEEANWVIKRLKAYNYKPNFPVFIDVEAPEAQTLLTKRERTDVVHAFCKTMKENGYYPGVYANKYWLSELLYSSEFSDYAVWVAQYNTTCTYTGKYGMWQYTNTGAVNGINGNVDISECYYDYPSFIRKYGYNGFTGSEIPPADNKDYSKRGTYKITASQFVRTGTADSFMSLGTLAKDSEVYVDYAVNGWGAITYGDSTGWIKLDSGVSRTSKYILTQSKTGYYRINTSVLNVRSGATTDANKISELYEGDTVFISGIQNGWGYFYGSGTKCWISLDYADFYGTVSFETGIADKYIQPLRIKSGSSAALPKWDISASGKQFSGWSLTSGGAVKYADKALLTMGTSNVVLYAVFSQGTGYYTFKTSPRQSSSGMVVISDELLTGSEFINKYISLTGSTSYKITAAVGSYIGTGSKISFASGGKNVSELTVAVSGDCSGDGICDAIDIADAMNISQGSKSKKTYTDAQKKAADINLDGKVDSTDIDLIKKTAFGTADLPK